MLTFQGIHAEIRADRTPEKDIEGGRDSGKTTLCLTIVLDRMKDYPGIEWLICRYSGTETDNTLRPAFLRVCHEMDFMPKWVADNACFEFPNGSKTFAFGLKTQDRMARYSKIRGPGVAGVYNDQSEELPEDIATESRAIMRQPGYPHELIFSPNPPDEYHYLTDQFPEDNSIPHRKYYSLSLYDNAHNLPEETIRKLEQTYPPTHAKHKSLILGKRGVNVYGVPVYQEAFLRDAHVRSVAFDPEYALLESIDCGKHNPSCVWAQRARHGGLRILGGLIGKRLFLEDFLPEVLTYRREWFERPSKILTCCDPPPTGDMEGLRFTNIQTLRDLGFQPLWRENANAPDVREAVIESIAGQMKRRAGHQEAFSVTNDPDRWLMISSAIEKSSTFFVDGLEGTYVWDEHFVSVGNKKVRQPKIHDIVEGPQRCLENLVLNFCAGQLTDDELNLRRRQQRSDRSSGGSHSGPLGWMAT